MLGAYNRRCAISNPPLPQLLQAVHTLPDRDRRERRDRREVTNGLCLSTPHHGAHARNLLGIDPDGIIHIAEAVVAQHDGPTLKAAIKEYHGRRIHLPRPVEDWPDRDLPAARFVAFRAGP